VGRRHGAGCGLPGAAAAGCGLAITPGGAHNGDVSTPRNQRPGCFLTAFALLLICAAVGCGAVALAAPESMATSIDKMVPRQVQVAVGLDHVWASLRLSLRPADLGLESWQRWDRDGDGALSAAEKQALGAELRDRETEFLSLAVDGQAVRLVDASFRWEAEAAGPHPLDAAVLLRVEARQALKLEVGLHRYVLYDKPALAEGIVPIRFSLARGLLLGEVAGARAERRSPRRLEAVVSNRSPGVWGTFERAAQP